MASIERSAEQEAIGSVEEIYQDIKETLCIDFVPSRVGREALVRVDDAKVPRAPETPTPPTVSSGDP